MSHHYWHRGFLVQQLPIQRLTQLLITTDQRHEEAVAQIANETFHFTFGLGPIGLAQAQHKSIMVCKIPQARVKAVLAFTIGVAGLDHRAHVVVKHLKRYATKLVKGLFVTGSECLELFILHKGSKGVAAETQGGHERRQPHGSEAKSAPADRAGAGA